MPRVSSLKDKFEKFRESKTNVKEKKKQISFNLCFFCVFVCVLYAYTFYRYLLEINLSNCLQVLDTTVYFKKCETVQKKQASHKTV